MGRYNFEEKNKIISLVNTSKLIIRLLASIVAIFYGWIKFKGFDFQPLINQVSTELLIKLSIIIYYFSWLFGTTLDGSDQGVVFQKVINEGKLPKLGVFISILIAFGFFTLCALWESNYLPIVLTSFWILDFLLWIIFTKFVVKPFYEVNDNFYLKKNFLIKKRFEIVKDFLYSNWHIYRFITRMIILLPIVFLSISNYLDEFVIGNDKGFYIALLVLVFVITVEIWIWYFRLKRKFSLSILTEIIDEKNRK